jgi:hypothetical protein
MVTRPSAIALKLYCKWQECYLQDPKAGGTWYVVDENGTVLVLLNGAEEKHTIKLSYKSRGLIVFGNVSRFWNTIDLDGIEPFTIVLFQEQDLFNFGGVELKEAMQLDTDRGIFGLLLLCTPRKLEGTIYLKRFRYAYEVVRVEMYDFHRHAEEGNGLVINRNEELKTFSISCNQKQSDHLPL